MDFLLKQLSLYIIEHPRITLIQEQHTKHIRIEFHTTELWWTLKLHLHHANKLFSEFSMNQETPNKAEMRDQSSLEIVLCRKSWLIDSPAPLHTTLISNDILAVAKNFSVSHSPSKKKLPPKEPWSSKLHAMKICSCFPLNIKKFVLNE